MLGRVAVPLGSHCCHLGVRRGWCCPNAGLRQIASSLPRLPGQAACCSKSQAWMHVYHISVGSAHERRPRCQITCLKRLLLVLQHRGLCAYVSFNKMSSVVGFRLHGVFTSPAGTTEQLPAACCCRCIRASGPPCRWPQLSLPVLCRFLNHISRCNNCAKGFMAVFTEPHRQSTCFRK
jgi:hypothetical protein